MGRASSWVPPGHSTASPAPLLPEDPLQGGFQVFRLSDFWGAAGRGIKGPGVGEGGAPRPASWLGPTLDFSVSQCAWGWGRGRVSPLDPGAPCMEGEWWSLACLRLVSPVSELAEIPPEAVNRLHVCPCLGDFWPPLFASSLVIQREAGRCFWQMPF